MSTDSPAKLAACSSAAPWSVERLSAARVDIRHVEVAVLALAIAFFVYVVSIGETFSTCGGRWLLYLLLWGPMVLPVVLLPDWHVLNFAFSWARNFDTHFPRDPRRQDEGGSLVAKLLAVVAAQDGALSRLSLRLPGGGADHGAEGMASTREWVLANFACYERYKEGLFAFKMLVLAAFLYGVSNKPLWAALRKVFSYIPFI